MAQGHVAYRVTKAIEDLPFKISVLTCWSNKLLVGSTEGKLYQYDDDNATRQFRLVRQEDISHKRIAQIECAPEIKKALVLANGVIHYVALDSLQVLGDLTQVGGSMITPTSRMTVTRSAGKLCVCVAVDKTVFVLEAAPDGGFALLHELSIPEQVTAMIQLPSSLCLGSKKAYSMANLHTRQFELLFETGASQLAVMTEAGAELVLQRDETGICVNSLGKPTRKTAITWSCMPSVVVSDEPNLLGLLPNGIEVRSLEAHQLAATQFIPLRHVCSIQTHPDRPLVFAGAVSEILQLTCVPISDQITQLLEGGQFESAISMCSLLEPKLVEQEQRSIHGLYACNLFSKGSFKKAFQHFSKSDAEPVSVVALVPDLLPPYVPQPPAPCNVPMPALVKSLLQEATTCAVTFVETVRGGDLSPDVASVLDTALLKALLILSREEEAMGLLNGTNCCHLEESARLLERHEKPMGLVSLYSSHKMHRKVIDILSADEQTSGHSAAIKYLQESTSAADCELVFEVMRGVLRDEPEAGLKVFTKAKAGLIPTAQVVAFLDAHAPELRIQYLECVIRDPKIKESEACFHNQLAILYLESVVRHKDYEKTKNLPTRLAVAKEAGSVGRRRKKLILFLEHQPRCYEPQALLDVFPCDELYQERAILLRAVGSHDQALSIYVHHLHDDKLAERYCMCLHNADPEAHHDIYLLLLKAYLQPPEGFCSDTKAALALLDAHIEHVDPVAALQLLPDKELSIKQMMPFISAALRYCNGKCRNTSVQRHLLQADMMQLHTQLSRLKRRYVVIADEQPCSACHAPLAAGQAFALRTDRSLAHVECDEQGLV